MTRRSLNLIDESFAGNPNKRSDKSGKQNKGSDGKSQNRSNDRCGIEKRSSLDMLHRFPLRKMTPNLSLLNSGLLLSMFKPGSAITFKGNAKETFGIAREI
jgi:hypothetical protein